MSTWDKYNPYGYATIEKEEKSSEEILNDLVTSIEKIRSIPEPDAILLLPTLTGFEYCKMKVSTAKKIVSIIPIIEDDD